MRYQELDYQTAIKSAMKGKEVVVLPKGINPGYLAFGVQKYHPCAIPLVPGRSRRETVWDWSTAKCAVLEEFCGEPGASRTAVTSWEVQP